MVVLFNHPRHPQRLCSAVETGTTFFSRSFTFTFLPPSLAKPGTGAGGASRGRLNVYDAIKSSVVQAAIFRARTLLLPVKPGTLPVKVILSSLYWPIK